MIAKKFARLAQLYKISTSEKGVLLYQSFDLHIIELKPKQLDFPSFRAQRRLNKAMGNHRKLFVIRMNLLSKSESLNLDCLTNSGTFQKTVDLNNIIPVTHEDYRAMNKRKLFLAPPFIDNEMIYYNTMEQEFYVFDLQGNWNEEGLKDPALDLNKRFHEKKWLDNLRII